MKLIHHPGETRANQLLPKWSYKTELARAICFVTFLLIIYGFFGGFFKLKLLSYLKNRDFLVMVSAIISLYKPLLSVHL